MNEKDFEILRILNETKNITHAADLLYITQSALSKRIQVIENELGKAILIRSRQGIRFTPAGETVLAHSILAAKELEHMRQELDSMESEICGTLNAGVSVNFAQYRLPELLTFYHKAYPRVRLHLTTGHSRHLYRQLLEGALDFAILRGEYAWDGMRYLLSQENICLVYSLEYRQISLSDFLYISHKTDQNQASQISRWMREQDLSPNIAECCVDSITTCMEMVQRGLGWALLPEIALDSFHGFVRPCLFKNGEPFTRKTYLLLQQDAAKLPQVIAFTRLARSACHL